MQNDAFKISKRYRHQEEFAQLYSHDSWSKRILNVEGGTVLGRTPLRWLFLLIFYVIFFGCMVLLWYLCYIVFDKTLKSEIPKWTLQQPGFSFEPSISKSYLNIEYYEHLEDDIDLYLDRIDETLRKYGNVTNHNFGPCNANNDFGYKGRSPCVFLKINRMIGFNTETFERAKDLPQEAPKELREYLEELTEEQRRNRIWISCESKPSLVIEYHPSRYFSTKDVDKSKKIAHEDHSDEYITEYGIENSFFYDTNDFQRIIAIRLLHLPTNVRHHIRCYLWAKNIVRDVKGKMGWGMVRFEIVVKI